MAFAKAIFLYFFLGWLFLLKVGDIQCAGCSFKTILIEKSVISFSIWENYMG